MGNVSIDLGLENIWKAWFDFRHGKKRTPEIEQFSYYLEEQLSALHQELVSSTYRHGGYHTFTVTDNKRRVISVASIRDRVVHRLLYNYLVPIYNKLFYDDVWSCRPNKGVVGSIERVQKFVTGCPRVFVWRTDITKFFDHVNGEALMQMLRRTIAYPNALWLLEEIIVSFHRGTAPRERERERE